MKILHLFPEEFRNRFAREYHVYRLAESLAASGCEVTLAAAPSAAILDNKTLLAAFGGDGCSRLAMAWMARQMKWGPLKISSSALFYKQVDTLIEAERPDAVFTMHLKAADHIIRKHPSLPLIFEAHEIFADSYLESTSRYGRLMAQERRIYEMARAVVAISGYLGKCLRDRFDLRVPLHVQHDGIDAAMLANGEDESDPRELIYLGSLQPWKGVPVAVEAMRLLPEYHLTVVGGEGDKLQALRTAAPANVTFPGTVTRAEMGPFLRRARIGLMPNLLEPRSALYTFPLKLLEYSAAGKGIVASRIPAFDDLDVAPWVELVPSGSAAALADRVRALAQRKIDRDAARNWAAQFLWEKQGAAMKQFLESVIP